MAIFDQQDPGGSEGLDPKKVGEVGLQGLKHAATGLRALFRVLPFMKVVSLGAVLALLAILGTGLVVTVVNGTYQVRQMVVTGTMEAKLEPGMWLKLFSDITESRIIYCQSRQREDCFQKAVIKRGLRRIRRSALRARSSSSQ